MDACLAGPVSSSLDLKPPTAPAPAPITVAPAPGYTCFILQPLRTPSSCLFVCLSFICGFPWNHLFFVRPEMLQRIFSSQGQLWDRHVLESPLGHDSKAQASRVRKCEPIHTQPEAHAPVLCPGLLTVGDSDIMPSRADHASELFVPQ